jgi:hypothetical protein
MILCKAESLLRIGENLREHSKALTREALPDGPI